MERCSNVFKPFENEPDVARPQCVLQIGHEGLHQAEFPAFHCHVDAHQNVTPDVEQPFRWNDEGLTGGTIPAVKN